MHPLYNDNKKKQKKTTVKPALSQGGQIPHCAEFRAQFNFNLSHHLVRKSFFARYTYALINNLPIYTFCCYFLLYQGRNK